MLVGLSEISQVNSDLELENQILNSNSCVDSEAVNWPFPLLEQKPLLNFLWDDLIGGWVDVVPFLDGTFLIGLYFKQVNDVCLSQQCDDLLVLLNIPSIACLTSLEFTQRTLVLWDESELLLVGIEWLCVSSLNDKCVLSEQILLGYKTVQFIDWVSYHHLDLKLACGQSSGSLQVK